MAGGMKLAGQARHAFMLAGDRSSACAKPPAASLNRSALCNVGVDAEAAVQWLLASAANVRITRSSVPSGFPGRPAAVRLRPRRADSFCSVPPLPPAWEERHLDKDYFANDTVSACRSMTKHPNNHMSAVLSRRSCFCGGGSLKGEGGSPKEARTA